MDGNVHDMYETILLHSASYQGTPEMVGTLLDHGVKLNAKNHWGETVLHVVSRGKQDSQGGVRVAKLFLERGMDVNTRRKGNVTPLHVACHFGKLEIVRLLLDHGADANTETVGGLKLLHQVSFGLYESNEDGVRVAQLLLKHGAEVDTRNKGTLDAVTHGILPWESRDRPSASRPWRRSGGKCGGRHGRETPARSVLRQIQISGGWCTCRTAALGARRRCKHTTQGRLDAVTCASYFGNVEIVRLLLDHGADPEANAEGDMGEKPLHKVSYGKYRSQEDGVRVAQLLLEHGGDVNTRRKDGWTPLHVAAYFGNVEIVRLLLDHGADPEANAEGDMGEKPLHKVSYGKYRSQEDGVRVAQLLLEHGGDVNTRRKDGWTPLHVASYFGDVEIVRLLLDHGADPEANAEGDMGEKPLHKVSYGKYRSQEDGVRVAQLLLEHGGDVNTRRKDGWTPLHLASYFGDAEIVRLLLDHGADPEANAEGDMGEKPLHKVSYGKYRSQEDGVRVAQLLLEHGADVNTRRDDRWTPLHLASLFGKFEIVQVLIDHGAEVDAVDDFNKTPLHEVSQGKSESEEDGVRVARLLLDHGADVNAKERSGHTPLALVSRNERPKLAELLLEHAANVDAQRPSANLNQAGP